MTRLDVAMVARGLVPTRSRALDLIRRGFVSVGGVVVTKAGHNVGDTVAVLLAGDTPEYVSRGAEKLAAALDHFGFDPSGLRAADIGASTGGFTQVLLARGAASVTAVDVGRAQLHDLMRADPRVTVLEGRDARTLVQADFAGPVEAISADVSFISLEKAMPAVLALAQPGAWLVALITPQFEVGRDNVGKGGIVRDEHVAAATVPRIAAWLKASGWRVDGTMPSPITGGDGNHEFLIGARKAATERS